MQASAVVATRPWSVSFQTVQVPDPGPEDVVIRVSHSWISNGTEGSFVRGERIAGDTPRGPQDPLPFPHVPGYQKVGIVESVGECARRFKPGDRVFATVSHVDGMFYPFGGHVSPAVTHYSQVWRIPDHIEPWTASGLVLAQVGFNTATCAPVSPGDTAVVLGDGLVGHWTAQILQAHGARVLLAGRHDERLGLWKRQQNDRAVNCRTDNLAHVVTEWAPDGVNLVADTVGSIQTIEALYPAMKWRGHIVSAGFYGHHGLIDIQTMRARELVLHAPSGWSADRMDATLEMLSSGRLTTTHLLTHRLPVIRAAEAFDLILFRQEPVLGVVLDWDIE